VWLGTHVWLKALVTALVLNYTILDADVTSGLLLMMSTAACGGVSYKIPGYHDITSRYPSGRPGQT